MNDDPLLDRILDRLEGTVEVRNGSYKVLCPAHDDHRPSLELKEAVENGSRKVLIKCWAGCQTDKIPKKLGLGWKDLFSSNRSKKASGRIVDTYDYTSPDGDLLHQTVRYEPKKFLQRRPDGNGDWVWNLKDIEPVLYRTPELMRAITNGETVFVVEGEKDADRAYKELGVTATTCPMGAGKWRESYTEALRDARVVLIPDNDKAGRSHMFEVAGKLDGVAQSICILELPDVPEKGDLSNWLDSGGTPETFNDLVQDTPEFDSGHIEERFDRNESLPVKSVSEIFAESGEGPDWKVVSLLAKGNITDLSGEAKFSGKTTFAMHMLSCIRRGVDFMGFPTVRSKVLYLTEQGNNFAEALQKAALEDADGQLFVVQHRDVRPIEWSELIASAVEECKRREIDVLIVDTFAAFSGIVGSEENNSGDIKEKMAPLKEAAQEHDLAILYIRHAGKSGRARGSSQFEAEGDIILTLKRPEGNNSENVRVLEGIGRYDEIPRKLNIELTEQGYVARGSDGQVQFGKAVEVIKQHLPRASENAKSQDELFEEVKGEDVSKKTMQRALEWLVDAETICKEGRGVKGDPHRYWMPPAGPPFSSPPGGDIHSGQTTSSNDRNGNTGDSEAPVPDPQEQSEPLQCGFEDEEDSGSGFITDADYLLTNVVPALRSCADVSIDIETTGLSPFEDELRVVSLHADGNTYLIDCREVDPTPVLEVIKDKLLYIHWAEFDLPFLYHAYGFVPTKTLVDTLHLSQMVRAGEWEPKEGGGWKRIKHSLKEALLRELGVELGDKAKYQRGKAWQGDLSEEHAEYAAGDVLYLKALAEKLFSLLKDRNLEETWKLEQRAKPLFLEMCRQGIPFDKDRWDELVQELEKRVLELKERADALAPTHPEGKTWNWFSPKALRAFELTGLKIPNLQRETLAKYKDPLVKAVSEYRDAENELSRTRNWYKNRYKEGRVYPQWNPGGTVTGRASCTSPNIQSLAKEGGYRRCIRP